MQSPQPAQSTQQSAAQLEQRRNYAFSNLRLMPSIGFWINNWVVLYLKDASTRAAAGYCDRGGAGPCHTVSDAREIFSLLPHKHPEPSLTTRSNRHYNDNRKRNESNRICPRMAARAAPPLVKGHLSGVSNAPKLTLEPQHLIQLSTQGSGILRPRPRPRSRHKSLIRMRRGSRAKTNKIFVGFFLCSVSSVRSTWERYSETEWKIHKIDNKKALKKKVKHKRVNIR